MLRFSGFELDLQRSELRRPDGETVRLRPKSFALLRLLARNANRVVGKQHLMESVWPNVHVGEDSLFQCIREIRAAIGDDRRQLIKVVSGRGYLFDADVTATDPDELAPDSNPTDVALTPRPPLDVAVVAMQAATKRAGFFSISRRSISIAAGLAVCAVGLAVAAPFIGQKVFPQRPLTIAVMPLTDASNDAHVSLMAANVTDQLVNGLSRIPNIRVLAPPATNGASNVSAPATADLVLRGELQKIDGKWKAQARIADPWSGEVRWTKAFAVEAANADIGIQQSRLTAGIGHPLAGHISAVIHSSSGQQRNAQVVIDEAQAFINRASRENAKIAKEMLEKALAQNPNNVDLQAALAAQLLRGIQTSWYSGDEAVAAEAKARNLLEHAIKTEPNYLPLLEGYCRFLTATNNFIDSLIACAKAINQNPWDGLVLFQTGMSQLQLGRFEDALSSFLLADRYDTPQVSRWTWLLGVGLANILMNQSADAIPWLERSLAITPGTGRTHFVLAAAYQQLGRTDDAKAAIAAGTKVRPGTTAQNIGLPQKNASDTYLAGARNIVTLLLAAGMPEK